MSRSELVAVTKRFKDLRVLELEGQRRLRIDPFEREPLARHGVTILPPGVPDVPCAHAAEPAPCGPEP